MKCETLGIFMKHGMLIYVGLLVTLSSGFAVDVNVNAYGVVGNGVSDESAAIQNAVDYVYNNGGGKVFLNGNQRYYLGNILEVKSGVTLRGDRENFGSSNIAGWDNMGSALVINSAKYVTMKSNSAIHGVLLFRQNQALPEDNADANFAGKAIYIDGNGIQVRYCAIIGFNTGLQTAVTDTTALTVEHCNIDCINGIKIENSSTGTVVKHCHVFPFITAIYANKYRNGTGYVLLNVDNATFEDNFVHAHKLKGFLIDECDNSTFKACGADNLTDVGLEPLGIGFEIRNGSNNNTFIACQAASQVTGFYINIGGTESVTIKAGAIWNVKTYGIFVNSGDVNVYTTSIRGKYAQFNTDGIQLVNANSLVNVYECSFKDLYYGIDKTAGTVQYGFNLSRNVVQFIR